LVTVLVIVILLACGALAFVGVTMCRLAARSDAADAFALAEWIATTQLAPEPIAPADGGAQRLLDEPPEVRYRATG
jgi:hypothetical protein